MRAPSTRLHRDVVWGRVISVALTPCRIGAVWCRSVPSFPFDWSVPFTPRTMFQLLAELVYFMCRTENTKITSYFPYGLPSFANTSTLLQDNCLSKSLYLVQGALIPAHISDTYSLSHAYFTLLLMWSF